MDSMRVWIICLVLLFESCGAFAQQECTRAAAAFEVPLLTEADKTEFIALLKKAAVASGYHVDAASPRELRQMSEVSPITLNATVWRGNDEEVVASAMDLYDHIGRVWLSFFKGEDSERFATFRTALISQIEARWPGTASLPITTTGTIPLADDLIRTPSGYVVKSSARQKYQLPAQ
jgi:hypothetical protein